MKASDLNSRFKLFRLLWRGLRIRRQRPSFSTESSLIVCQVQAGDSARASFAVRGVFTEVLSPDEAPQGAECAGYRDSGFQFISGRAWPSLVFIRLGIIKEEFFYTLKARSVIAGSRQDFSEMFESYAEARAGAISWIRGCLLETGDIQESEAVESEPKPIRFTFAPGRAARVLNWMDEADRRELVGDTEPADQGKAAKPEARAGVSAPDRYTGV